MITFSRTCARLVKVILNNIGTCIGVEAIAELV